MTNSLQPVIQLDRTGCGLASVAVLTGRTYTAVKREAASLGIHVSDPALWGETRHVRKLLARAGVGVGRQRDFVAWESLPARALLAIKWHREKTGPAWHWVVFVRDDGVPCVLDPKRALRHHRRTDFGRMKPKWFLPIGTNPGRFRTSDHESRSRTHAST